MPLPPGATPHSHALLPIAEELANACPPELGVEIALAGSVSRGWADEHSDIELNFWLDAIEPWPDRYHEWLTGIGCENIHSYEDIHPNGSRWLEFDYKGVPVEAGWHSIQTCDSLLQRIISGEVDDMFEGYLAESLAHSIPLLDGPNLQRWRAAIESYPDAVRHKMIESAIEGWRPYVRWYDLDLAFLLRPEPALIAKRIDQSIRLCLRILFAVNGQWEPDERKWIRRWCETLEVKPDRVADRIYAILGDPLSTRQYADLLDLTDETLALVPKEYDVTDLRERVVAARSRLATLTTNH